ncbi:MULTISPECIES: single-stranded-DNA-specific exonuclease RecJ [unclassified Prochlorococcus]|uniref:single-stranded-DNA-specific exonuclease RecJ n=1 Tax=unclassified Prochlorococcus TaxID=2627481 RepID=UPI000533B355|nr:MULTISPECIES: single-stranded-DNA-specific exonuclease RecJ [unclassified Prochlorococcus]KGG15303.1 Single-stranded-DNA-specific exonuclease RecJ [Prochlorococcus sp. MIT 0602]KGG17581.1 Single-stranded-DNA-specific exonuclease RecJ [Prochlorococcus sp. MIT 0603]
MQKIIWNVPTSINISPLNNIALTDNIKEVLYRRGFTSPNKLNEFISPPSPENPSDHFPFLDKAASRVEDSIRLKQEVAICGDYDADGMTSTALLVDLFRKLGGRAVPFIPSRTEDGYGLNNTIIDQIHSYGIKLLITVDNGVSAINSLQYAKQLGIDVIITDHHRINNKIDNIYALIHPETTPINSPYKTVAGVGVTYLLALEIAKKFDNLSALNISRDLLCIGTIADMSPLTGVNRYWLKKWISNLHNTQCLGLKGIIKKSKLGSKPITAKDIGFKIAPRINSIGRIDNPKFIIDLLLEQDNTNVLQKVDKCEEINTRRKLITRQIEEEALKLLQNKSIDGKSFILLAQSHWNCGVIGIVAARIMERYSLPTAILSCDGEGLFRASVRSPKGINVIEILNKCSDLLEVYGGHSAAAGFTVKASNLMKLEEKLQSLASNHLSKSSLYSSLSPESYLSFSDINKELIEDLNILEPFGIGNPQPLFWTRRCRVIKYKIGYFGQLILLLEQNGIKIEGTQWSPRSNTNTIPEFIDIAFNIELLVTNKDTKPTIIIVDYKKYSTMLKFSINKREYSCEIDSNQLIIIKNQNNDSIKCNLSSKEEYLNFKRKNNNYINRLLEISTAILGINTRNY